MAARPNAGTKGVPRADREQEIVRVASVAFGADGFAATLDDRIDRRVKTGSEDKGDIANVRLPDGRRVAFARDAGMRPHA